MNDDSHKDLAASLLNAAFPPQNMPSPGFREACISLIPHTLALLEYIGDSNSRSVASLYNRLGYHQLTFEGNAIEAERNFEKSLKLLNTNTETDLSATKASVLNNLAAAYMEQSKFKESLSAYSASLEEHQDVTTFNNYCALLLQLGKIFDALGILLKLESILENSTNDAQRLVIMQSLAVLYMNTGEFQKSEEYLRQIENVEHLHWGLDDLHAATLRTNKGLLCKRKGDFDQANNLYLDSLKIFELHYGMNHPALITPLLNLGALNGALKNYGEAERNYDRALDIQRQKYGDTDHLDAMRILTHKAKLSFQMWELEEVAEKATKRLVTAKEFALQSLQMCERLFGNMHHEVASAEDLMGQIFLRMRRFSQARNSFERALRIRKAIFGPEGFVVGTSINNIGCLYMEQSENEKAEVLFREAIGIQSSAAGQRDEETRNTTANLIKCLNRLGKDKEIHRFVQEHMLEYETKPKTDPKLRLSWKHLRLWTSGIAVLSPTN